MDKEFVLRVIHNPSVHAGPVSYREKFFSNRTSSGVSQPQPDDGVEFAHWRWLSRFPTIGSSYLQLAASVGMLRSLAR